MASAEVVPDVRGRTADAIAALLLPGTPREVAERYLALPERAKTESFGLLEEDIVMLDTETTGLSFRKNELIEIAAARICGGVIQERFQTFVHPTGPIPAQIQVLTGIKDLDVIQAPSPSEAVAALAAFVGGMPVVAHNAAFDKTFVEQVPGGETVSDTWIDSLALSRIALPCLKTHRLADMAQAFGCANVTHRATDDVDALCGMWRILLLGLSDLPAGLLDRLAHMHEEVAWPYRTLLSYVAQRAPQDRFVLKNVRHRLLETVSSRRRDDSLAEDGAALPLEAVSEREVRAAFDKDGLLGDLYEDYEKRPEQLAMACEVRASQATSTHRAIEAGTGVGKSMAYLLPSILFAQRNNVTVGVATKTNALSDQLMAHELPLLDAALPQGVHYTCIKGFDHYPCLRRVELAMVRDLSGYINESTGEGADDAAADVLTALASVLAFACQSPEGDVDALGIRWRHVSRELICTTSTECMRTRCPYFPHECFVHGARRRAACSDIVVTNHAMLLRDIALEGAILPSIRHWIVDEAHSFEQEARKQWAHELSSDSIRRMFQKLGGLEGGILHTLLVQCRSLDSSELATRLLTKAAANSSRAQVATNDLLTHVRGLSALVGPNGAYDNATLWIDDSVRESDEWHAVENSGAMALSALEETYKAVKEVYECLLPESPQLAGDLQEPCNALADILTALRVIVFEPEDSYVYSADLFQAKRKQARDSLLAQKLDVGSDLARLWYPQVLSVTYTSATMAVGKSFEHFEHAVGLYTLPADKHAVLQLTSSFDMDAHMAVVVARNMPEPGNRAYLSMLEDLLLDVHRAMEGSVLTLFTNRREMELTYRALVQRMEALGLQLAMQERNASPRRLRERFMQEEKLSLFALKSFWEGFDAAGKTLRCVVIPKLPFASPRDPLVRERESRDRRAWWKYSLPEAVLEVRQASGRLIRTHTDTGVLVLADSRLVSKRYGKTFLDSLPSNNVSLMEQNNVGSYIRMWRTWHER